MPTKTGELVVLAAKGDKNALAELYTTNFKSAYFPACGLLQNKQEALKTVIGCFAKAFANLSKLPKPDEFEDFIKQITVKKCIDIIKKKKGASFSQERPEICRNEIGTGFEFLPIDVLNSKELTSAVLKTVNSMPDTQRICVYLCYYNGYSASATAKLVSCTEDNVNWHLLAAREQIKNAVDSKLGKSAELSEMNGTSILSLVMELMKKEFTVNSETVKKSFFMVCEKSGLFGEPQQKKAAPAPVAAYAPPIYSESAYEQPAFVPEIPQVQRARNEQPMLTEQKKSGGKTAIIIAVIAVLMIVAGVFAYWFVTKDDPDSLFATKETTTVSGSGMIIGAVSQNEGTTYYFPSGSEQNMIIGLMQTEVTTTEKTEATENETTQPETTQAETSTTQPQTEPTTAKKSDGYMAAYNEYLRNYNGGVYENGFYFGFGYFNNDDIPEMFISVSGVHYGPVQIYTCKDGKVVSLGDYGHYGTLYYVERQSVVVSSDVHMGRQTGIIIKVNDDGSTETIFKHFDNGGDVGTDSEDFVCEINDEPVSPEEYFKIVEETMSIETNCFYEDIKMTPENIIKHCK